ncbi:lipoate--protein ligase family protein [Chloroflexales bacterium ZM16-3]|nr:lipoate--protein ligase family protein [Chloroflexales bacterium ZM16-3]
MPTPIRLIDLGPAPFWLTQAAYHAVAGLMGERTPDTIILTSPRTPYLCLGYHDSYDGVLDRAAVARRGLPVMRRRVGGGTTYLDAEQIFYQCVFHSQRVPAAFAAVYAQMLAAPLAVLRDLGLTGELRNTVELEVAGQRVAGIGGGRIDDAAVVVGNLLLGFDYAAMADVWRAPWPGFRALAAEALAERVTTLRRLGVDLPLDDLARRLRVAFAESLGRPLLPGRLTPAEARYARQLGARMLAPEYVNLRDTIGGPTGARPLKVAGGVYIHVAEADLGGRRLRASLRVHGETIAAARVEPEGWPEHREIEAALVGAPLARWREVAL